MKIQARAVFVFVGVIAWVGALGAASANDITLHQSDGRVRVELGGKLFTEYVFAGAPKPYFYPVLAADGTELVRNFPMKRDVPGEEMDHPHHRGIWFTHGAVNGVDFWTENGNNKGKIVSEAVEHSTTKGVGTIRARNRWNGPDGTTHATDETTIRIRALAGGARWLDYQVTLIAPADKPVVLGDTKEGSMAIRLPVWMTPAHVFQKKTTDTNGTIVNDQGARNADAWGKRATWVDYHGPKDGTTYGVAMFDHPTNPRHPTWWHVRDYGLFAANPFGQHDFERTGAKPAPARAGDLTIPAGGRVTFRWRFYFHFGDEKTGAVAQHFREFAAEKNE